MFGSLYGKQEKTSPMLSGFMKPNWYCYNCPYFTKYYHHGDIKITACWKDVNEEGCEVWGPKLNRNTVFPISSRNIFGRVRVGHAAFCIFLSKMHIFSSKIQKIYNKRTTRESPLSIQAFIMKFISSDDKITTHSGESYLSVTRYNFSPVMPC